jgi:hypothetical protein
VAVVPPTVERIYTGGMFTTPITSIAPGGSQLAIIGDVFATVVAPYVTLFSDASRSDSAGHVAETSYTNQK